MKFFKETYQINKIRNDKFLAYTHLGLGDHIVCNGLLNYFSESFDTIYLPVKSRDINNINYLYKDNPKIQVFKIEHSSDVQDINNFANKNNLIILKVGFKKRKPPFNLSFYEQFNLSYSYSISRFSAPKDINKEETLYQHLREIYGVKDQYQIVHNQSSYGKVSLQTNEGLPTIFIEKETDLYKNIFLYSKVIKNATEIHCLDSSFLHLVERMETNANLFFHNIKKDGQKGADVHLVKNWQIVNYFK
jgi:hypothetical protein